jgi:hypothetical protein
MDDKRARLACALARCPDRLVNKYMLQPRLMKLNRMKIDENHLSSDVVSIALTHFLNALYTSLKYAIQFFLIDALKIFYRHSKKLVLVNQLNPLELSFTARNK